MKALKRSFVLIATLSLLALVSVPLSLGPAVPEVSAAQICPEIKPGSPAASDVAINPNKIIEGEELPKECDDTGLIAKVICKIKKFFANLSSSLANPGKLNLKDSLMPGYLRTANELALSGDLEKRDEVGEITGGIAKAMIPGYTQDELDPIEKLTESEGQLVAGEIILNNRGLQKSFDTKVYEEVNESSGEGFGEGYYDLQSGEGAPNYQVEGRFGEIAPLHDRFGFLKQILMPSAGAVEIPDEDCIGYDPSVIVVEATKGFEEANPNRDVPWTAYKPVPSGDQVGGEVACDTDDEGNVVCPSESGSETYEAKGNLDVQTEVSLASETWKRIGAPSNSPGEGGVFNILLPPDTSFRTDEAEPKLKFSYDPHSSDRYPGNSTLYIADLGNVEGSTSCIKNQLTAHPIRASYGTCETAFRTFGGVQIVCTDEATPLEFSNTGSGIAARAWDIVNRLYQGFWCLWNWDKDGEFSNLFDEEAYRQEPNPPYPLPAGHSGNLFWCTELVRRSHNDLSLSTSSRLMAVQFGAADATGGPSNGRWISIDDATYQNIPAGSVLFLRSRDSTFYPEMSHVGIVYSTDKDILTIVQSNGATKEMYIPVLDNGKISPTIGGWEIRGFGKP